VAARSLPMQRAVWTTCAKCSCGVTGQVGTAPGTLLQIGCSEQRIEKKSMNRWTIRSRVLFQDHKSEGETRSEMLKSGGVWKQWMFVRHCASNSWIKHANRASRSESENQEPCHTTFRSKTMSHGSRGYRLQWPV